MSRYTTGFTTDPVLRARQELRNRLERIRDEAQVTAGCVGEFPGNEPEQAMWETLAAMCDGYISGINEINEAERRNKTRAASAARFENATIGHDLAVFEGSEPA